MGSTLEGLSNAVAVAGAARLAWIAASATRGRQGLFGNLLVAGTGAIAGWFLAVRVFAVGVTSGWLWVGWALGGAFVLLGIFAAIRGKR